MTPKQLEAVKKKADRILHEEEEIRELSFLASDLLMLLDYGKVGDVSLTILPEDENMDSDIRCINRRDTQMILDAVEAARAKRVKTLRRMRLPK